MNSRRKNLDYLMDIANNPRTEFDKIIAENKKYLLVMPTEYLNGIWILRSKALHLCTIIPYSREDVRSLVENEEVDLLGPVAELDYTFACLEYIFSKVNGKDLFQ